MQVLKRDGRIEVFNIQKIIFAVQKASDEAEMPLNRSDLNLLSEDIVNEVESLGITTVPSTDVQTIVIHALLKLGFDMIAKYYKKYKLSN